MFKNLREFLSSDKRLATDKTGALVSRELQIAAVAVMLDVAQSDADFEPEEVRAVVAAINREFGLDDQEAAELVELSQFLAKQPEKRKQFLAEVNKHFSVEQREVLLAAAWRILAADRDVEKEELDFVTALRQELDLTPEQAIRARMLAERGLVSERVREMMSGEMPDDGAH